jgi:hypothetical protein
MLSICTIVNIKSGYKTKIYLLVALAIYGKKETALFLCSFDNFSQKQYDM